MTDSSDGLFVLAPENLAALAALLSEQPASRFDYLLVVEQVWREEGVMRRESHREGGDLRLTR